MKFSSPDLKCLHRPFIRVGDSILNIHQQQTSCCVTVEPAAIVHFWRLTSSSFRNSNWIEYYVCVPFESSDRSSRQKKFKSLPISSIPTFIQSVALNFALLFTSVMVTQNIRVRVLYRFCTSVNSNQMQRRQFCVHCSFIQWTDGRETRKPYNRKFERRLSFHSLQISCQTTMWNAVFG